MLCPCGSESNFSECCELYISGKSMPETAETLMRSRYVAYVQNEMDYILETHHPRTRKSVDMDGNRAWAESADWLSLEVVNVSQGRAEDDEGSVEFIARYRAQGVEKKHHEVSVFEKQKGRWYFVDGKNAGVKTIINDNKIGRNEPCPCDSGKKYKKCCGR